MKKLAKGFLLKKSIIEGIEGYAFRKMRSKFQNKYFNEKSKALNFSSIQFVDIIARNEAIPETLNESFFKEKSYKSPSSANE